MKTDDANTWEDLYAAAVLETDPERMNDRIEEAQEALRRRWQDLHATPDFDNRELHKIEDAMRTLFMIRDMELRAST